MHTAEGKVFYAEGTGVNLECLRNSTGSETTRKRMVVGGGRGRKGQTT